MHPSTSLPAAIAVALAMAVGACSSGGRSPEQMQGAAPERSARALYIVQSTAAGADAAARVVRSVGGHVFSTLRVISAVGAELDARQVARVRADTTLKVFEDAGLELCVSAPHTAASSRPASGAR